MGQTDACTIARDAPVTLTAEALLRELRISRRTLHRYEHVQPDPLPCYRPGGWRRRYVLAEVVAWLRRRRDHAGCLPASRNPEAARAAAEKRAGKPETERT
jgi:hypothetical protein